MIHQAVSGRFLLAGPAIVVPVLFEDVREAAAANLRDGGIDAAGLTRWQMSRTIQSFDDVGPWLIQQHEHDHVELFGSTPIGVLLFKTHQIQGGRLNYLLTKLSHHLGDTTFSVRPFLDWFLGFAATQFGVQDHSRVLDAPQLTRDPVWAHCAAIVSEIDACHQAERVLLSSRLHDPDRDVAALNEALGCIAGFAN